jgi:hypothetical protein
MPLNLKHLFAPIRVSYMYAERIEVCAIALGESVK